MTILRVAVVAWACFAAVPAHAAWTWTKLDYPGAIWTYPHGISGDTIVGNYEDDTGIHGFMYDGNTWISFTHPKGWSTAATGISDGRVVGFTLWTYAFIYDGLTWTDFAVTGLTRAHGIYKNKVVGYYDYNHVIYGPTNSGFVYDGETVKNVRYPDAFSTMANAIWEDTIVGQYSPSGAPGEHGHGFIYDGQTWRTVAKGGALSTRLTGIDGDRMVGIWHAGGPSVGFLLEEDTWTDIRCPWGVRTDVYGISGDRIVGYYRDAGGRDHGFLLTIPEPGTLALLAIGGIVASGRRRSPRTARMRKGGQA
jgi:hypothetical protein